MSSSALATGPLVGGAGGSGCRNRAGIGRFFSPRMHRRSSASKFHGRPTAHVEAAGMYARTRLHTADWSTSGRPHPPSSKAFAQCTWSMTSVITLHTTVIDTWMETSV